MLITDSASANTAGANQHKDFILLCVEGSPVSISSVILILLRPD